MNIYRKIVLNIFISISLVLASQISFAVVLDKVVAVVNSQVITQSQLTQQMKMVRNQLQGNGEAMPSENQLRQKVLNQLIDEALQLDVAKKAHLSVSDAQVTEAIQKIASQNNISVGQLISTVGAHGISEKSYREQIRKEMLLHEVQQKMVAPQVNLTKEDVENSSVNSPRVSQPKIQINAQTRFHVVDIIFSTEQLAQNGLATLQKNRNQLKKLEDVKTILSGAKLSPNNINDLGFRTIADFPTLFAGVVKSLRPGEFSSPIKAPNGYHLLLLAGSTGKYSSGAPTLTREQKAFQSKFDTALQAWLLKLRNQSYIKITDNE